MMTFVIKYLTILGLGRVIVWVHFREFFVLIWVCFREKDKSVLFAPSLYIVIILERNTSIFRTNKFHPLHNTH